MLFAIILFDKPGAEDLRQRMRPAHKAYLAEINDKIAFAGPLTHDDGKAMIGSLLVIDFDSREQAQAWLAKEPFTVASVYASTTVNAFVNLWPQATGFPPVSP